MLPGTEITEYPNYPPSLLRPLPTLPLSLPLVLPPTVPVAFLLHFPSFFPSLKTRSIHVIIGLSPAAERNRGSIAVSS